MLGSLLGTFSPRKVVLSSNRSRQTMAAIDEEKISQEPSVEDSGIEKDDAKDVAKDSKNEHMDVDPPVRQVQQREAVEDRLMSIIEALHENKAADQDRIARLEALVGDLTSDKRPSFATKANEQTLYRQLGSMRDFDGKDESKTWESYVKEFVGKASLIKSLPKSEWVSMLHSHVTGDAYQHAESCKLVVDMNLVDVSFEEYCSRMQEALFSDSLSTIGKIHKIISITQTEKCSDVMVFLKEKEKYLNKLPAAITMDDIKAALALWGMDTNMLTAICPNPHSKDGQFHSYEEIRKTVVATVGLNKLAFDNAKRMRTSENQTGGWHKVGGAAKPWNKTFAPAATSKGEASGSRSAQGPGPSTGTVLDTKPKDKSNEVCKDCGQVGHWDSGFWYCPRNPRKSGREPGRNPNQLDGKGKGKRPA